MGLSDGIKDLLNIVQKVDNVELYQKLLDLGTQALELQSEVVRLREENAELKKQKDIEADIEYYVDAFVTKKSDNKPIIYCAACWADKRELVTLQNIISAHYECPLCNTRVIDRRKWGNSELNN